VSSAMWSPLQLTHLNVWRQGSPCLVSRRGGFSLKLALQHQAKSLWFLILWGPPHFWHFVQWALHEKVVWPHFQQLWHCGIPGFILVPLNMAIYLPKLNEWLISVLALEPFCESQMSTHMMAMSDFGDAFITRGLAAKVVPSNNSLFFR